MKELKQVIPTEQPEGIARQQSLIMSELMTMAWRNVSYTIRDNKTKQDRDLLSNVSGVCKPGEVMAIMGPSGAGKSTLLELLGDRLASGKIQGSVVVNGKRLSAKLRRQVKFVQQDDQLNGVMSVYETLWYAAHLTLPYGKYSNDEIEGQIDEVINVLGLASCRHTRVGNVFFKGLSGGQKRRLSIGIELIARPSILLLDEPTSGLDSKAASVIVEHLCHLAATKLKTILMTIHQPSAQLLAKITKLMLLSKGTLMYSGPTNKALDFFKDAGHPCPVYTNPADHFLDLINTDFENHINIEWLAKQYESSEVGKAEGVILAELADADAARSQQPSDEETTKYAAPRWYQFYILTRRQFLSNLRDPGTYWARIVMYLALGIMLGTLFYKMDDSQESIQNRISLLFFVAAFMVFMSVAGLPFFMNERTIFVRERANGMYAVDAWVLSIATSAMPCVFVLALLASATCYPMTGLRAGGTHFAWFLSTLFFALYTAEMLQLFMAACVPHYIIAIALSAFMFGMFMCVQGFFLLLRKLPNYWLWVHYVALHTYAFRAFMKNEFAGTTWKAQPGAITNVTSGRELLLYYELAGTELDGIDRAPIGQDNAVLFGMSIIYCFLFYAVLYIFHKGKK